MDVEEARAEEGEDLVVIVVEVASTSLEVVAFTGNSTMPTVLRLAMFLPGLSSIFLQHPRSRLTT